jgi:hypothetical protein
VLPEQEQFLQGRLTEDFLELLTQRLEHPGLYQQLLDDHRRLEQGGESRPVFSDARVEKLVPWLSEELFKRTAQR